MNSMFENNDFNSIINDLQKLSSKIEEQEKLLLKQNELLLKQSDKILKLEEIIYPLYKLNLSPIKNVSPIRNVSPIKNHDINDQKIHIQVEKYKNSLLVTDYLSYKYTFNYKEDFKQLGAVYTKNKNIHGWLFVGILKEKDLQDGALFIIKHFEEKYPNMSLEINFKN